MTDERAEKNQIFAMANEMRAVQAEQVRAQMGANLPVNTIPLPSKGLVYSQGSPLHLADSIQLKAMTVQEENILTSQALIKKGTVITALIQSCLVDKNINVNEMLAGDRNILMVAIRSEGYGNVYEIEVKCPSCTESATQEFDLNAFPIKFLDIEPVSPGENAFPFKLPQSGKNILFRFLTGKDEEDIVAIKESKKKLVKPGQAVVDDSLSLMMQYAIVSIDGDTNKGNIANYVRSMRTQDSRALRRYIADHSPSIEMKQDITCPHCGHVEKGVDMPIGVSFFWPDR